MAHVMKKRFGQNFLKDKNLLKKIVEKAIVNDKDVIEIGPGQGALTEFIAPVCKSLTCYEIDYTLESYLNNKFSQYQNFTLIINDFLEENLNLNKDYVLIGNIPYYITSPILFKFLEEPHLLEATLMMQKEVGERLAASVKTKAYNALSVIFQHYTKIEKLLDVKKHLFYPPPKVDSVVMKITKKASIEKDPFFEQIVKLAFSNKRKMAINNLSLDDKYQKADLITLFDSLNVNLMARAEEISVAKWEEIVNNLKNRE